MRALAFILTLMLPLGAARADAGWEPIKTENGVRYEKRWVASSKLYEYRGTWFMPKEPAALIELIWANIETLKGKQVTEREVVSRGPSELVMHDQVKTPIVSDRELTLR